MCNLSIRHTQEIQLVHHKNTQQYFSKINTQARQQSTNAHLWITQERQQIYFRKLKKTTCSPQVYIGCAQLDSF